MENRVAQQQTDASPFNADFRIGGLYDSRVGATSSEDLTSTREDSGTALVLTANAGWQAPYEGDTGLRLDYSGYADFHQVKGKNLDQFDVIDQSLSLEPQYKNGQFVWSLPIIYNFVMEAGIEDYVRYGVSPTLTYLIPTTSQALAVNGVFMRINDRDDVEDLDEDGESFGGGCAYLYFFENKSRIKLSLDYQHTAYDERVTKYESSFSNDDRKDKTLTAGIDAQFQITTHVGLYTNYSFIHSNSNVSQYEYDRHVVEGGVAFKF